MEQDILREAIFEGRKDEEREEKLSSMEVRKKERMPDANLCNKTVASYENLKCKAATTDAKPLHCPERSRCLPPGSSDRQQAYENEKKFSGIILLSGLLSPPLLFSTTCHSAIFRRQNSTSDYR